MFLMSWVAQRSHGLLYTLCFESNATQGSFSRFSGVRAEDMTLFSYFHLCILPFCPLAKGRMPGSPWKRCKQNICCVCVVSFPF